MPSASASFSANCTGSFGVLIPTRSVVTSGFGSVPGAALAVAAPPAVGDAVAGAPPPHAAATRPDRTRNVNKTRLSEDICNTSQPPDPGRLTSGECNPRQKPRLQFAPNQMHSTEPVRAPDTRESSSVDVGGHAISYQRSGAGVPLLLIAGTGYPGGTWHPDLVEALAARHTVVTFDHRGTGATASAPGRYSTQFFAGDALGTLDALGPEPAHVVGHSTGRRGAQGAARGRPA